MDARLEQYNVRMNKTIDNLKEEYATIRAGRANPHLLDNIRVDYYGQPSALQAVANISVPEARVIAIQPWENKMIKEIEKAINISDLGLTPSNDGKIIRLVFPELTEERRKDLVKDVKKRAENSKVAIRNIRREANDSFRKMERASEISEDELKGLEKECQDLTDSFVGEIDTLIEDKSKEVLTV